MISRTIAAPEISVNLSTAAQMWRQSSRSPATFLPQSETKSLVKESLWTSQPPLTREFPSVKII